ncbi:MAG: group 1 glycosyl transferase, partial [Parcubacteria group bacterium Greene0714_36]
MDKQKDERRKILFLITKSNWGGAQQYVYDIATNLPKDRFETVVAGGGNGILFAKLRDAGIKTISLSGLQRDVAILGEWRAFCEILRTLKKERPDVAHLNSSKAAALGALAVFICKILNPKPSTLNPRTIFTVHGWPFLEDRSFLPRAIIFLISWITCFLCDRVILISKKDEETARRFLPRRKNIYIPHGLASLDFGASRKAGR